MMKVIVWVYVLIIAFIAYADLAPKKGMSPHQKTLPCDDAKTQKVRVALGRLTILSFPVVPKDILPGESSFDFRQIKNDLAIKALRPGARTNAFVYMAERRCSFDIVTVQSDGDDMVLIKDPQDKQFEVNFK